MAWVFSTVVGIFLFMVEIGLLCWIQFEDSRYAQFSSIVMLVLIVAVFIYFVFHFYSKLVRHTYSTYMKDLEPIRPNLKNIHDDLQEDPIEDQLPNV